MTLLADVDMERNSCLLMIKDIQRDLSIRLNEKYYFILKREKGKYCVESLIKELDWQDYMAGLFLWEDVLLENQSFNDVPKEKKLLKIKLRILEQYIHNEKIIGQANLLFLQDLIFSLGAVCCHFNDNFGSQIAYLKEYLKKIDKLNDKKDALYDLTKTKSILAVKNICYELNKDFQESKLDLSLMKADWQKVIVGNIIIPHFIMKLQPTKHV